MGNDLAVGFSYGAALVLFVVIVVMAAFRAGYRHAKTLHDIAGGDAGDKVLREYEPPAVIFEKRRPQDTVVLNEDNRE